MAKPNGHINWGVGNTDPANRIVEPSSAKKTTGWNDDEQPPAPFFNWLFNRLDEWVKYLEQRTDNIAAPYDVVIGDTNVHASATHDTLQAAVDDGTLGSNQKVLILDDYTVNATITLSKAGWRIYFDPGVTYSKGSASTAFQISAADVDIRDGRFAGWSGGSDVVFQYTATADYNKVVGARFGAGTTKEYDDSLVAAGKKPLVAQTMVEV